jgi:hypothetical protein
VAELIVLGIVALFVLVTLAKSVRIVTQALGQLTKALPGGDTKPPAD